MIFSNVKSISIPQGAVSRILSNDVTLWQKSRLPSGYQEVEYLEGTGTQFIDTELNYFADFEVEIQLRQSVANKALGNGNYSCMHRLNAANPYWQLMNNVTNGFATTVPIVERHVMKWKDGQIFADGVKLTDFKKDPNSGSKMLLYSATGALSSAYPNVIYFCKLWDSGGNLVRDYVPCYRKSDNVAGLYDLVTGKLFTNAGTGSFIVGAKI